MNQGQAPKGITLTAAPPCSLSTALHFQEEPQTPQYPLLVIEDSCWFPAPPTCGRISLPPGGGPGLSGSPQRGSYMGLKTCRLRSLPLAPVWISPGGHCHHGRASPVLSYGSLLYSLETEQPLCRSEGTMSDPSLPGPTSEPGSKPSPQLQAVVKLWL